MYKDHSLRVNSWCFHFSLSVSVTSMAATPSYSQSKMWFRIRNQTSMLLKRVHLNVPQGSFTMLWASLNRKRMRRRWRTATSVTQENWLSMPMSHRFPIVILVLGTPSLEIVLPECAPILSSDRLGLHVEGM